MFFALVCGGQTVNVNQIRPSTTNTQVITTVGGATVWAPAPGGIPSAQGTAPIQVNGASGVPATDAITVSCPTCGAGILQTQVVPPVSGQFVAISATSNVATSAGTVTAASSNTSGVLTQAACNASSPPCSGTHGNNILWSGFELPSGVAPSSVTEVIAYISASLAGSATGAAVTCTNGSTTFGIFLPHEGNATFGSQPLSVVLSGVTGSQIPSITCSAGLDILDPNPPQVFSVDLLQLLVYYTGSPVQQPDLIAIASPLTFNSASETLGFNTVYNYGTSGGSSDAYTLSLPALSVSLTQPNLLPQIGQEVLWTPSFANTTTSPTLNLNGSGAASITKGPGHAALASGDLNGNVADTIFDGLDWELQNPQTSSGGGGGTITLTGPVTGSGTSTIATTITPTGVTAGSYTNPNITLNAAGQVLAASNGSGGSGSISVNGASVSSPNLNGTTPAAPGGSTNCTWAVSGSSVSCSVPNGGSASLPSAAAPGQIIASTAAGTTYAPVGNVFYSQSGDTVASIEAECSSPCTYVVTQPQTITLTASHTLNANVNLLFQADGIWTINGSTFTLSIPTQVAGTLTQHFVIGTGLLQLGVIPGSGVPDTSENSLVPVEWFGAKGDFNVTDNTTPINNTLNSIVSGQALLQASVYMVSGTLSITKDSVGVAGTKYGFDDGAAGNSFLSSSVILQTSASADTIDCAGPGGGTALTDYIKWNKFNDFAIERTVTATGNAAGLSLAFCGGATVDHVHSQDSVRDFYFHSVPSFGIGIIENSVAQWGFGPGLPATAYGFYLDSSDGNAENSLRMFHNTADTQNNSGSTTYGIFITGSHINDVMVDGFETDEVSVGISVNSVSPAQNFSDGDIHFWHCINDSFFTSAIQINNVVAASGANVEIEGGWAESVFATGPAIDIESSNAVKVIGMQIGSTTTTNQTVGVLANNSSNIVISDNTFRKAATAFVELENTNDSTVTGNSMASLTSLTQDILVTGTSSWNVISGNSIAGTSTTGVVFGSSTTNNTMLDSTAIDTTSITTAFTNAGTDNTIGVSSSGGGGVVGGSLAIVAGTQAANTCATVATVTDTGLTTSGAFSRPTIAYSGSTSGLTGWDAASPGMKLNFFTSSANTMGYEICNYSSSSISYSAITFQLGAS